MKPEVIIVDDDPVVLKRTWSLLDEAGMKPVVLKSGEALFKYLDEKPVPDLVLLDIVMPDMDGFELLEKIRMRGDKAAEVPVVFLTANEDDTMETKSFTLGAMDFIRKSLVANIFILRVKNAVQLSRLQRQLESEVDRKTKENEELFLQLVASLADAIDAKDNYTNGHSGRVADYSKEIARRCGYDEKKQEEIHTIALLHDIGKIGVPDEVINKPGRLTDEEFALIKKHPSMGGKILENIKNMPSLLVGAKWHHERFDGRGYPDGLKGDEIPKEARLIAVADAYDAMSSNRSYRRVMPQERVREEIVKGRGTQFDPEFADIMLQMIDEDTEYLMRDLHCNPEA